MILVDTGIWFASLVPSSPDHQRAFQWLESTRELLLVTDYIAASFDHHFKQFGTVTVVP